MTPADIDHQLDAFEYKQQRLAVLIRTALGINRHTAALEDLLLLSRPSQSFPAKVSQYMALLKAKTSALSDQQLSLQADKYENTCQRLLRSLRKSMQQAQNLLTDEHQQEVFSERIQEHFKQFKHFTQTSVGLRALLQERGLVRAPMKFGFPQAWLGEQIEQLQQTNRQLRQRVKTHLLELIHDAQQLLTHPDLSGTVEDSLHYVEAAMRENLQHLEAGGRLQQFPHDFEALELTSLPQNQGPNTELPLIEVAEAEVEEITPTAVASTQTGLLKRLRLWLNSPWKKRWRDLD